MLISSMSVVKKADEDEHVPAVVVDLDPLGELLLATKEPLVEAIKWLRPLEQSAQSSPVTWQLSYEVNIRRGKYLLALRALRNLAAIAPDSSASHLAILHFLILIPTISASLSAPILATIEAALPELAKGSTPAAYNTGLLQQGLGLAGIVTVARGAILIGGGSLRSEAEALLFSAADEQLTVDLRVCPL